MLKLILSTLLTISFINLFAQDAKDVQQSTSKFDTFASKTGTIIKYIDDNLPELKLTYGVAETRIRTLHSGGEKKFFYQISHEGKYGSKTASIAYEDLVEVLKAIDTLKEEAVSDLALNPDYLENKFVTDDGFQLGYYVSDSKQSWYIVLDKYGSGNTIFPKNLTSIIEAFTNAKIKMDSM